MTDHNANDTDLYQLIDLDPGFSGMDPNGCNMHGGNVATGNGPVFNNFDDLQLDKQRLGEKRPGDNDTNDTNDMFNHIGNVERDYVLLTGSGTTGAPIHSGPDCVVQ
jgi:hypothetical protein